MCVHIGDMTHIGHVHVPPPLLMGGLEEEEGGERHEALTLHLAKWSKVLFVLQNATAQPERRQDQGSTASNVSPLPLLFVNGRDQEVQDISDKCSCR